MHDTAERLVDHLLPAVPYRQWVLTVPRSIRYLMAQDREALGAIHRIVIRSLFAYQRREAKKLGFPSVRPGAVTFVQTFGSALNLNVHFHVLAMDGVFVDAPVEQPLTFVELPLIEPRHVERLLARIARRIERYAEARHDDGADDDEVDGNALTASRADAVQAGKVLRQRDAPEQHGSDDDPLYCASGDGFSLHANVYLRAGDTEALKRLVRYGARQSFAEGRLSLTSDGRVRYKLSRPWGPTQKTTLTLEPVTFLHRLAALIPAPYLHLTRYSGIFAPNAHRRWEMTAVGIRAAKLRSDQRPADDDDSGDETPPLELPEPMPRSIPWAELLARTFKVDVLECPRCSGRMEIIAFITDLIVVKKILTHLGLPAVVPTPEPVVRTEQLDLELCFDPPFDDDALLSADELPRDSRGPPAART